jgi:hypothetical protein
MKQALEQQIIKALEYIAALPAHPVDDARNRAALDVAKATAANVLPELRARALRRAMRAGMVPQ